MAGNSVAANLLMVLLLAGGVIASGNIEQRIFPKIDIDEVHISVAYPGATPEEVEQGVTIFKSNTVKTCIYTNAKISQQKLC